MAYWLLKSEPEAFSWQDQVARGAEGEPWSGVRNHQAKNFMKQMKPGDYAFFYHTGNHREIVGIVEIASAPFPDPTDLTWIAVTTVANQKMGCPISLSDIKNRPELADIALLKQSRLSVQPVTDDAWAIILAMGGIAEPR